MSYVMLHEAPVIRQDIKLKKKRVIVDIQDMQEINGSASAYERYVANELEDYRANPDLLPEQPIVPSNPQLIMGEAIEHLQGRQQAVYLSVMREDKSLAETGEALGISKSTVQVYLARAIKFIKAYCEEAIRGGRV